MLLAIDTATLVSSVALAEPKKIVAELTINNKKTHSELLMPHIEQLLAMSQFDKTDITAIAVSIGPGSFTGLRIGLATAKALAYAWRIPLVGVPTLTAQAYSCPAPGVWLCPLLDAQKGNVYQALYRWESGQLQEVQSPQVTHHQDVIARLLQEKQPVLLLGEGALLFAQAIGEAGPPLYIAPPHVLISRAATVALLGQDMLAQGICHDPMTLEPLYIRRSEAEVLWEQRQGNCS